MTKFVKVKVWVYERFSGDASCIPASLDSTEEQVRAYIERQTSRGGAGNYKKESLKVVIAKVKTSKANCVDLKK